MSLFKSFQKQKQISVAQDSSLITSGINRIRFIQKHIADKGNFFSKILYSQPQIYRPLTRQDDDSKTFITTFSNRSLLKRPFSQLNILREQKQKYSKEQVMQKAQKIRQQRKKIETIMQNKNKQILLSKLVKKRKCLKDREQGKIKIQNFMQKKKNLVKDCINRAKIQKQNYIECSNNFIEKYQEKLLIGQKIREILKQKIFAKEDKKQKLNEQKERIKYKK